MSKFDQVARLVGTTGEALRDAMNDVGRERCQYYVSITVKGVYHGRMAETRRSSVMWQVAELLQIEPEDLRDAVAKIFQPIPGQTVALTHRVRLLPDEHKEPRWDRVKRAEDGRRQMLRRRRDALGRILPNT